MLIQRTLAWLDRFFAEIFMSSVNIFCPGSDDANREEHYYSLSGPRIGILYHDGSMEIGGYFEVVHRYDKQGKLLSRTLWKKAVKKKGEMIKGTEKVYVAYRKSSNNNVCVSNLHTN
ncbi:hypothetical protein KKB71_00445 [Patescibacteria group bacterium]|nr:hypothetical protein [Patescibacteria group bacterium]